jgi:universal stress protein A
MADIQWKKICCPVDFSEYSRTALRVAVDLAKRFDADLTLFYSEHASAKMVEDKHGSHDQDLATWRREAEGLGVARVSTAKATGEPQVAIVEYADLNGFDLIVMGTHGRTGRDHALVGSVAEAVVRRARCPVLTVHHAWPERRR